MAAALGLDEMTSPVLVTVALKFLPLLIGRPIGSVRTRHVDLQLLELGQRVLAPGEEDDGVCRGVVDRLCQRHELVVEDLGNLVNLLDLAREDRVGGEVLGRRGVEGTAEVDERAPGPSCAW